MAPCDWHYENGETYVKWATKLKEEVRNMIEQVEDPLEGLEMVDDLQRLGVFYHFEDEIKQLLDKTYVSTKDEWKKDDLYATALKFRLFRQHGYHTSQEVFNNFRDEMGTFKAYRSEDIKGLLYLYEASYLLMEGENILEDAREFSTRILKQSLERKEIDEYLALLVSHALEVPLHWRVPRLEARWFIDVYQRRPSMNPTLLGFAKLDFNIVQATYQEDLKHVSRWWRRIGLAEKLSFARDRLMENFLWFIEVNFKPQFGHFRRTMTIVNALITVIDDVYDVYGTLDELEPFTEVVRRWDISNKMDELPPYMKTCFLALFDSVNEIGLNNLKKLGVEVTPYLHKAWADLCTEYLVEAKWYHSGYTPTFEEYMDHAWISISGPVLLTHAYFLCTNAINKEALECLEKTPNLARWSSTIFRLANDLGTSQYEMNRGDVPKSIQCFMQETGASEEEAREHIKQLIGETWKKINKDRFADPFFSQAFIEVAVNLARMSQCMYRHGDGHAAQGRDSKDRVMSLIVNPITLREDNDFIC
ncbi:(-)-alpha-terpineol synthase [Bertholletia excelsa]